MKTFPDFDFKIDCGDAPKVRQWLHDNGCLIGIHNSTKYRQDQSLLSCRAKSLAIILENGHFNAVQLPTINPYDYIRDEPTVAERMAALIAKHKDALPNWARWIAVDENGDSYVFKEKPYKGIRQWRCTVRHIHFVSEEIGELRDNWNETLTEIPTIKPGLTVAPTNSQPRTVDNMAEIAARDRRELSEAENDYDELQYSVFCAKRKKPLTIPSICLRDTVMPMMLGGQFGALHADE